MDETAALMRTYQDASPVVQRMYQALNDEGERIGFLRTLRTLGEQPGDPSARRRWERWVSALLWV